jgi:ubiquinone/menaquinone biosynthesis C-methylase UbiE
MLNPPLQLNEYKQAIAESYNDRSQTYDNSNWHPQICHQLLKYARVLPGQHILDIGTGTGHLAIAAAELVGESGRVIGIDISPDMLDRARQKVKVLGLTNIEFKLADAERLNYSEHSLDRILCANTFPWLQNKAATLELWYRLLKPDGIIGIHTPDNTAYVGAVILKKVLVKYGVVLESSNRIGSISECVEFCKNVGLEEIEIHTEQHGSYTTLDRLQATWESIVVNPSILSLKDTTDRLSQLTPAQLTSAQAEFTTELETLQTDCGIWDDLTTLYILGRKLGIRF